MDALLAAPSGKRDLLVLVGNAHLLEAEGKYAEAFAIWSNLVERLKRVMDTNPPMKEKFFDCYFHMIRAYYRFGTAKPDKAAHAKYVTDTGARLASFERELRRLRQRGGQEAGGRVARGRAGPPDGLRGGA